MRRQRGDAGFSLPELSVSTLLVAVLCLAIGSITLSSQRAMRIAQVKIAAGADARVAMEAMSRTLRVAVKPAGESAALVVGHSDAITFYALLNPVSATTLPLPTRVEYYRDATRNCLMEAKTPAVALSAPSGGGSLYTWNTGRSAKCLLRTTSVPTAGTPWFSYFTTGQLVNGGTATTPLTVPNGGLGATDLQSVRSVAVAITVTDPANPGMTGVSDEFRVTLSNVSLANGGAA